MRILMVNLPFAGHTNPTLPLARALVEAGHEVTYINAECMRGRIERTGAAFVPYRDYPDAPTETERKKRSFRALWDTALTMKGRCDLLIYEMFFYPGFTLAQEMGVPCVRQWSQPAWNGENWPHKPLSFRAAARVLDMQLMSGADRRYMRQRERTLISANLHDQPALNIAYLPEEMQDGREMFGADYLFLAPPAEAPRGEDLLPWAELPRPIVYVSMGSIMSDGGFLMRVVKGLGGREMTVILNTGRIEPATLGKLPENIHAFSFVPQLQVLDHADVFATHCGMNSVNEALATGTPMVALPVTSDQPGNAARLVELGAARRVSPFLMKGRKLREAVEAVWADEVLQGRVRTLRESLLRQQDMAEAVRRIEAVMEG